jgi:Kef-type K+ transport system membrane component KefB
VLFEGFTQLAALMAVAVVVGALAVTLRQPLIVGFIGVGIVVGPTGFDLVGESENIELLAKLGIAVLLFLVGLKLDPRHVRSTGPVALATGLGQVIFTSVFGYLIALALGFDQVAAVYVAVALTFSSTIIIVKLLSDKRELDDLHGRIAVGFLIVQDIVVVIALIVITALGAAGAEDVGAQLGGVLLRGFAFVAALAAITRWVLPLVLGRLARNRELLILFGVAWALAAATVGDELGLSTEVGAFLAGFTLAGTPYREAIASRLVSLRDFLLLFFFIDLGAQLQLGLVGETLGPALVFSLFVLVGNPLIVLVIMGLMGYRKRTAFLAGLTVAQISEFSLILVALGLRVGHVDESVLGLVTTVGVITIGLSTYLIIYSQPIFERLSPFLSIFERKKAAGTEIHPDQEGNMDAVVYGIGRHGSLIVKSLQGAGWQVMAVDVDPDGLRSAADLGCAVVYGDAEDPEFPLSLPLEHARWVVSTVPDGDINVSLLHALRASGYEGKVALTAHNPGDVERFNAENVDIVISPFSVAAERLVASLIGDPDERPTTID